MNNLKFFLSLLFLYFLKTLIWSIIYLFDSHRRTFHVAMSEWPFSPNFPLYCFEIVLIALVNGVRRGVSPNLFKLENEGLSRKAEKTFLALYIIGTQSTRTFLVPTILIAFHSLPLLPVAMHKCTFLSWKISIIIP